MILTQQDLQAIGNLIDEKLESKLEEKLESKLEEKIESKLEEKLKPIKRDLKSIKKTLDTTISFFDQELVDHNKRLNRVETTLGLSPLI